MATKKDFSGNVQDVTKEFFTKNEDETVDTEAAANAEAAAPAKPAVHKKERAKKVEGTVDLLSAIPTAEESVERHSRRLALLWKPSMFDAVKALADERGMSINRYIECVFQTLLDAKAAQEK